MNAFPQSLPPHQLALGVGETMANSPTLFVTALLLLVPFLTCAARPEPAFPGNKTPQHRPVAVDVDDAAAAESCQGIGEEECLTRRTLAAHVDYIYTQSHKQP